MPENLSNLRFDATKTEGFCWLRFSTAAEEFYRKLQEGRQPPNVMQYMHFRFMKETSKLGYLPADLEFYKDKDEYFYNTKISPLKKIMAPIIMKFAFFMMKDIGPEES